LSEMIDYLSKFRTFKFWVNFIYLDKNKLIIISEMTAANYCTTCFYILKFLQSCPRSEKFEQGEIGEVLLEILFVAGSFLPFLIGLIIVCFCFATKSSRGFCMFVLLAIQQVTVEVIKRILAIPRPLGACSLSYGFPSSHSAFTSAILTW